MTLRVKTVGLLVVLLAFFSGFAWVVNRHVVIPNFADLEAQESLDDLGRVGDALARELHHLDVLATDWAAWDDTYEFIQQPTEAYRQSNLNTETFEGARFDLALYLDRRGEAVASVRLDSETGQPIEFAPLPPEGLPLDHALLQRPATDAEPVTGIVTDGERVMLVAARPILPSDRLGPQRGTLILGRLFDDQLLRDIADQAGLDLRAVAFGTTAPIDGRTPAQWLSDTEGRSTLLELSRERLLGVTFARDLEGAPALVFTATMLRPIYASGGDLAEIAIPLTTVGALIVALLSWMALSQGIVRPILSLTRFVGRVGAAGELNERAPQTERADEIGELARGINAMLGRLRSQAGELDTALEAANAAADARAAFLARMSHELRTPLHGILGMITLLLKGPLQPAQREQARTVLDSADLLLTIISEVLDVSKIEADKLVLEEGATDLFDTVNRTISLIRSAAHAKAIEVRSRLDPSLPRRIRADSVRLRQVLNNLLGNAVKFTDRGTVSLDVVVVEETPERVRVRFEVADTGEGVPADQVGILFEAFAQARGSSARREGTGLGLTISKRLVEMMGGTIGVETVLGEGSTFWFEVPFARVGPNERTRTDVIGPVEAPSDQEPGDWRGATRILVADDNLPSRQFALFLLEGEGFQVDTVPNGAAAVEAVQRQRYDLVLMDSQMPVMTGFEATAAIRALEGEAARVPIIAVTAEAMRGDYDACLGAGMNDYVAKPIDADHLLGLVARYCQPADADSEPALPGHEPSREHAP
jgi:signal transduction histidine kinase/ActR/RegA family two-component response regulator